MQTIRRDAFKKIKARLDAAVLIREVYINDMGDRYETVTPDHVIVVMKQFEADRVYGDENITVVSIHGNWGFTAYASIDAARRSLVPQAFAKYFPES